MESNAVFGLLAVLATCWLFLGSRLALLAEPEAPVATPDSAALSGRERDTLLRLLASATLDTPQGACPAGTEGSLA